MRTFLLGLSIWMLAAAGFSKVERTLSIIKPDAVKGQHIGDVINTFEKSRLKIVAMRLEHLSKEKAEGFYHVHKGKPFFNLLVEFMTSGPIVVSVLEGEGAITKNRELMGATDPKKASEGSIRARFGSSIGSNAVHGSDAPETAQEEINFFFAGMSQ